LWGVVGRPVGSHAGFAYSPAMKAHGGSWTYDQLFEFLASPARDVPGTKMSFAGLRRPEDRAAVIRYLATLGNGAPPLPK
jgi:cytochrome c